MSNDAEVRAHILAELNAVASSLVGELGMARDNAAVRAIDDAVAFLAAEARSHDGEWVLVPKEPTEPMVEAGVEAFTNVRDIWSAMMSAVPLLNKEPTE